MAYNIAGLAAFTDGNPTVIQADIVLASQAANMFRKIDNVKYKTKVLDLQKQPIQWKTGSPSGWNAGDGSTALTELTMTVEQINFQENYQKSFLKNYLAALAEEKGSNQEEMPFGDMIMEFTGKQQGVDIDKIFWMDAADGSLSGHDTRFTFIDGIVKQLVEQEDGSVLSSGWAPVAFTGLVDASVREIVDDTYAALSTSNEAFLQEPTEMYMSPSNFDRYRRAKYNLTGEVIDKDTIDQGVTDSTMVIGTNCKALSITGLTGTNYIVCTRNSNLIFGNDISGEENAISLHWSEDSWQYLLRNIFKIGALVARPTEVVLSKV